MKIIISGASGLIGTSLVRHFERQDHEVIRLIRPPGQPGEGRAQWDPATGYLDPAVLHGADAVVNLNGRSISDGRWSASVKASLRSSRLDSTHTLARAIAEAAEPPPLLVNASATGYYGDRGDEVLDESADGGEGFLADLCHDWEAAATEAASERTRVVRLRFGMVLASEGGALERMLPPFRLGVGGPIGSGRQFWPWISLADVVGVVDFAITSGRLDGAINVVAPHETRCKEFTRTLGRVLKRPAVLPVPAPAVKLALGEMAESLLLASTRVQPRALLTADYPYANPTLEEALRDELR